MHLDFVIVLQPAVLAAVLLALPSRKRSRHCRQLLRVVGPWKNDGVSLTTPPRRARRSTCSSVRGGPLHRSTCCRCVRRQGCKSTSRPRDARATTAPCIRNVVTEGVRRKWQQHQRLEVSVYQSHASGSSLRVAPACSASSRHRAAVTGTGTERLYLRCARAVGIVCRYWKHRCKHAGIGGVGSVQLQQGLPICSANGSGHRCGRVARDVGTFAARARR
jgi:hypothetical protein